MDAKFSEVLKEVIALSREEALRLKHIEIYPEHIILAMIRYDSCSAILVLRKLGVEIPLLKQKLESELSNLPSGDLNIANIPLKRSSEKALKLSFLDAKYFNDKVIGTVHLLLAILRDVHNTTSELLFSFKIDYDKVQWFFKTYKNHNELLDPQDNVSERTQVKVSKDEFNNSSLYLEFEIPDDVSDEEALHLIKEGVLLADQTQRAYGGHGLKINDIRITSCQSEYVES